MPEPATTEEEIITMFVTQFAECVAVGNFDSALSFASLAQGRWNFRYADAMRQRAAVQRIPWPLPGDPGADDASGWTGWYGGGYGGALA